MGCLQSKPKPVTSSVATPEYVQLVKTKIDGPTKTVVRDSWGKFCGQVDTLGLETFRGLMSNSVVMSTFQFAKNMTLEDLMVSNVLQSHAIRFMDTVKKVVDQMDNPVMMVIYLQSLAERHIKYDAPKELMPAIGPEYIKAAEKVFGNEIASEEVKNAWLTLFEVMGSIMQGFMGRLEEEKNMKNKTKK